MNVGDVIDLPARRRNVKARPRLDAEAFAAWWAERLHEAPAFAEMMEATMPPELARFLRARREEERADVRR